MKYIKTPTGEVFKYEDCVVYEDNDIQEQKELSDLLFEQTGILVADGKAVK